MPAVIEVTGQSTLNLPPELAGRITDPSLWVLISCAVRNGDNYELAADCYPPSSGSFSGVGTQLCPGGGRQPFCGAVRARHGAAAVHPGASDTAEFRRAAGRAGAGQPARIRRARAISGPRRDGIAVLQSHRPGRNCAIAGTHWRVPDRLPAGSVCGRMDLGAQQPRLRTRAGGVANGGDRALRQRHFLADADRPCTVPAGGGFRPLSLPVRRGHQGNGCCRLGQPLSPHFPGEAVNPGTPSRMAEPESQTGIREITVAHSPDSDDAFMFYGLATNKVRVPGLRFTHTLCDIETLNRKAHEEVYDLTAISFAAYPYIQENYALLSSGGSVGEGYGPMIVATRPFSHSEVKN